MNFEQYLRFDPESGRFYRKIQSGPNKAGSETGSVDKNGYVQIVVKGHKVYAHRLAWFLTTGTWPVGSIDHINGCKSDNRLCNLRPATQAQNLQNQSPVGRKSKSGLLGAHWVSRKNKWTSLIGVSGKNIYLGYFDDPESAHKAYCEAKAQIHKFNPTVRQTA